MEEQRKQAALYVAREALRSAQRSVDTAVHRLDDVSAVAEAAEARAIEQRIGHLLEVMDETWFD